MKSKFEKVIEDNLDYIINEWQRCDVNQFNYNGFSCSKKDKIKQLIFFSAMLRGSYDVFEKLNLSKYFGKEYTEKLFEIFTLRNDYDLFQFLFVDSLIDNPEPEINSLNEIKEGIDRTLKSIDFSTRLSIYQAFYFRAKMSEKYPDLTEIIHNLIGDKNCEADGHEIGHKLFSLYWHISKEKYIEIMSKIADWLKENNLSDLMYFEIEKKNSENQIIGSKKIIKEYYGR